MRNSLVVISATSGCGKDTIIEKVCQRLDGIGVSISCTTRDPRPKSDGNYEQHGVDYFFINRSEFEERICQIGFLEYANNKGDLYGTPRSYVLKLLDEGVSVILEIDLQGAIQVKERMPESVSIFILPPSFEELESRLRGRGTETPEKIEKRLAAAKYEMEMAYTYDYRIVNDNLEEAYQQLRSIFLNETEKANA